MSNSGLVVKELHCGYGRLEVLKGLNAEFPSGSFTTVVGANGCGKSTLLKTVTGVVRPAFGTITLDGTNLMSLSPKLRAKRIGYVPQMVAPASLSLAALDIILLGLERRDKSKFDRVFSIADQLGLTEELSRPLDTLSGGQQQRVHIARALAQGAGTILLDEPISNLDLRFQVEVMSQLRCLAEEGRTIIAVIHDLNMAAWSSNHVVVMANGQAVASGPPNDCLTSALVEKAFGLPVEEARIGSRSFILPKNGGKE